MAELPRPDYLSFLFNIPNITPVGILSLFFLGLMRVAPLVAFVPFLGAKLPGAVKMGLAISLTAILLPHIVSTHTSAISFDLNYLGLTLKELFFGFILAILAGFPFYIAQSSGSLIDFLRGSSALQVTDPFTQQQTSPIGILYNYTLIVLFFQIGGPFLFLNALLSSYDVVPADQLMSISFFSLSQPFWKLAISLLTKLTAISVQLAAPSLVAILMAEMFLGIANRLAPQVQIVFLGMSLKSLLGLGLLFAGWFFILQQMSNQSIFWLTELDKVIQSIR